MSLEHHAYVREPGKIWFLQAVQYGRRTATEQICAIADTIDAFANVQLAYEEDMREAGREDEL